MGDNFKIAFNFAAMSRYK